MRIVVPFEPALRLERFVDEKIFADDALLRHGEAVLVPHAGQDDGHLELGRLFRRNGVEAERLDGVCLPRLYDRRGFDDHAAHVLQRLDQIGFAARVGAIDYGAAQQAGGSLQARFDRIGVGKGAVLRSDEGEDLFVPQAPEVLDAEFDKHIAHQIGIKIKTNFALQTQQVKILVSRICEFNNMTL